MEKKNKVILLVLALIAVVIVAILLSTGNNNQDYNADQNLNQNSNNNQLDQTREQENEPTMMSPEDVSVPADLNWRERAQEVGFEVEFMTDEEKERIGINPEKRVQVLARNDDGLILAYKVIESEDDIVTNPEE